jgi:hypothetical protein
MLDICLNTYGSLNLLGKFVQENNIRNVLYNPNNNINFIFDDKLIVDRLVYNERNIYATNDLTNIGIMELTKRLTFVIGTDKPNGNTVQDDLLKQATILLIFVGGTETEESNTSGYTFNKNTGTLDFTAMGGVSTTWLDILYNSAS